jgi:hypothetical protein
MQIVRIERIDDGRTRPNAVAKCSNRSERYRPHTTSTGLLICINELYRPACLDGKEKIYGEGR